MPSAKADYFKQLSALYWENGDVPEEIILERLAHFAELVVEKNHVINLISRRDIESVIENHIFISSFITKFIPERCTRFLDIGTGGGFPGIPVAITRPILRGVLVDSVKKKTDVVHGFIDKLMLTNLRVECSRVEEPEFMNKYKNSFDLIISRATVPLLMLIRYALPLMKDSACLLAMKGGELKDELKKASARYATHIRKSVVYDLHYRPNNIKNVKGKKLVFLELVK
jgi:16S rRNA (guanine527-N7)-methyltransferase